MKLMINGIVLCHSSIESVYIGLLCIASTYLLTLALSCAAVVIFVGMESRDVSDPR